MHGIAGARVKIMFDDISPLAETQLLVE